MAKTKQTLAAENPGQFADNAITKKGQALIAKALTGKFAIDFTRISLGDGKLPEGQTAENITGLISPKRDMAITKAEVSEDGMAVIGGRYSNENESEGFYWRELGLYATDPDDGEILFSYGNGGDDVEYIPASGPVLVEKLVDIVTYVGSGVQVTATLAPYTSPLADEQTITEVNHVFSVKDKGVGIEKIAKVDEAGGLVSYDALKGKDNNPGTLLTGITVAEVDALWNDPGDGTGGDKNKWANGEALKRVIAKAKAAAATGGGGGGGAGTVTTADLADGSVTDAKIAAASLNPDKVTSVEAWQKKLLTFAPDADFVTYVTTA